MRTSFLLPVSSSKMRWVSLSALLALAACTTEKVQIIKSGSGTADDGTETSTDGTDPAAVDENGNPVVDPESPPGPLVSGLAISSIAVFQGVKVDIVKDGAWVAQRNAPVVANRPSLVRVYVKPEAGWKGKSVTAELRIADGAKKLPVITDTKTISKASTDEDLSSTFNLEVPGDSLPRGATIQVALTAKDGTVATGSSDARFPKDGSAKALGAEVAGKLKVVVVPVKYMADGSGRTPDVSTKQLELYKKTMMGLYPAADVEVSARAPWNYSTPISGNGSGFSQVLNAVLQLRRQDGVGDDVYYYGALAPTSSFNSFCGGGCVTGLSTVVEDADTSTFRASVGIGFTGESSAETMAHEIGHAHGRNHAPCGGAQGVDPSFPYSGGKIGVWGYDIFTKTLISPTKGTDIMGYCDNTWVSDYTFEALFTRIGAVNQLAGTTKTTSGQSFRTAMVDEAGAVTWSDEIVLPREPRGGEAREVTFLSTTGVSVGSATARFYPYDHLPGGVLVVPQAPTGVSKLSAAARDWSSVKIAGVSQTLGR